MRTMSTHNTNAKGIFTLKYALQLIAACFSLAAAPPGWAAPCHYFKVTVLDASTGRGVPLVKLRTVNHVRFYTDSNGVVAINDPDMIGHSIYFHVSSPGYTYPKDAFGYRGLALKVAAGSSATIRIQRINIAERLYRMTGAGIYRDSVLTGQRTPIKHPLLDGEVMGQDTVEVTPYHNRLYWFFGDTQRPSYPLGQFATSGATSQLPGKGGLDPGVGVNLKYWVGKDGFSRPMITIANPPGPIWVGGLFTLQSQGTTHLYTNFVEVRHDSSIAVDGLAEFDDKKALFEPICTYPSGNGLRPEGHPFLAEDRGKTYLYFQSTAMGAFPLVRVRSDIADVKDAANFESFTCLEPGGRYEGAKTPLDRGPDGHLVWGWKKNTMALGENQADALVAAGKMSANERITALHDVETDKEVLSHGGSVFWNAYRQRWIMITTQVYGSPSFLGEVWFAEADTPVGPWLYATKIATHGGYTFYNPTQLPFFNQDNDRLIYFQGTYTNTYSQVTDITPRYNYNQLMYSLNLADPRLTLPEPVYNVTVPGVGTQYVQRPVVAGKDWWGLVHTIPFYAMPRNRGLSTLIPIFAVETRTKQGTAEILQSARPSSTAVPDFYALPAPSTVAAKFPADEAPLYEYTNEATGQRWYTTKAGNEVAGAIRSALPICMVWKNPCTTVAINPGASAITPR